MPPSQSPPTEQSTSESRDETRRADLASLKIRHRDGPVREGSTLAGKLVWLLSVVAAAAGGYLAAGHFPAGGPTEVATFRVLGGAAPPAGTLTATGYLQARKRASIGFKISGRLSERLVEEGDQVKAGDVLARMDDREQRAAVDQYASALDAAKAALAELKAGFRKEEVGKAGSSLDQARANRIRAEQDLERIESLHARNAAIGSSLDEARAIALSARAAEATARHQLDMMKAGSRPEQVQAAAARARQAEAMLALARTQLVETALRAPFDGTILEKHAEVGATLLFGGPPGTGSAAHVFTFADLTDMEAEIDIAESSLSRIQTGQLAEIVADAIPDRKYQGRLTKILPVANRQKAIVPVRVRVLETDKRLLPDMSVKVTFLEKQEKAADTNQSPRIPVAAVFDRAGARAVYLVRNGKLKLKVVTLGEVRGDQVEVTGGLTSGDRIVQAPAPAMSDGMEVKAN